MKLFGVCAAAAGSDRFEEEERNVLRHGVQLPWSRPQPGRAGRAAGQCPAGGHRGPLVIGHGRTRCPARVGDIHTEGSAMHRLLKQLECLVRESRDRTGRSFCLNAWPDCRAQPLTPRVSNMPPFRHGALLSDTYLLITSGKRRKKIENDPRCGRSRERVAPAPPPGLRPTAPASNAGEVNLPHHKPVW